MAIQRLAAGEITTMNEEMGYRAYIVALDGHFMKSHEFFAEAGDAALEYARQFVDGHDVELWAGGRLVAKLKRQPKKSGDYSGVSLRNVS
jgi:hypothetical protein